MPAKEDPIHSNRLLLPEDRRQQQGAWLLLASLSVFFVSSILLFLIFLIIRMRMPTVPDDRIHFYLPRSFIASTMLLLAISYCLHQAASAARSDRVSTLIGLTSFSLLMGVLFLLVQTEGMYWLLQGIREAQTPKWSAYSFTLFLAVVHALHVVGGVVALAWVVLRSWMKKYDHERHYGVQFCALYWHFLDAVWLIMLTCFIVAGWLLNSRLS